MSPERVASLPVHAQCLWWRTETKQSKHPNAETGVSNLLSNTCINVIAQGVATWDACCTAAHGQWLYIIHLLRPEPLQAVKHIIVLS